MKSYDEQIKHIEELRYQLDAVLNAEGESFVTKRIRKNIKTARENLKMVKDGHIKECAKIMKLSGLTVDGLFNEKSVFRGMGKITSYNLGNGKVVYEPEFQGWKLGKYNSEAEAERAVGKAYKQWESLEKASIANEKQKQKNAEKKKILGHDSRVSLDLRHQNIDYEKGKQLALKKEAELKSKYKNVKLVMKMPTNTYFEWEVSNKTKDAKDDDPKAQLIKYAEKSGDPEYIKHVKGLTNQATINARLQWHKQQKDEKVSPKFKKVMGEFGKGELKSSSGEKVTDPKQAKAIAYSESKDGGPGSGIKGHTTPENEKKGDGVEYDEKEIEKIKAKWENKESKAGYGSEYGDILNHLEKQASKAGILPDMNEYFKLGDKLIDLRQSGKKDTEEYKSIEKQRNDFNKRYNKVRKSLEEKAKSLSSEGEQKRIDEVNQYYKRGSKDSLEKIYTKGNSMAKDDDATEGGALREYGEKEGSFEDACSSKDAYSPSNYENDPRHKWTIKSIENEIRRYQDFIQRNRERIVQLRNMENSGQYLGAGRELKEVQREYEANQMKVKQLVSMLQRAKGAKDADPRVAEAEAIIKLCGGVM